MNTTNRSRSSKREREGKTAREVVTKKEVKDLIKSALSTNEELKFYDFVTDATTYTVDWNGITPWQVFFPAQGDGDSNRTGDSVVVRSWDYGINIRFNGDGTGKDMNVIQILVFAWKPFAVDLPPTNSKLFLNIGSSIGAPAGLAGLNVDGRDQFVLYGRHYVTVDATQRQKLVQGHVKMNHKVQFKAGNTTNMAGGLYFTCISDADPAASKPLLYNFAHRVRYVDA
jgi:hypothetical protein